jgi:hypothetical protein
MTVSLGSKRLQASGAAAAADAGCFAGPLAKKLRVLPPAPEQLVAGCHVQASPARTGHSQAQQAGGGAGAGAAAAGATTRSKRARHDGADGTPASPAPASTGKRVSGDAHGLGWQQLLRLLLLHSQAQRPGQIAPTAASVDASIPQPCPPVQSMCRRTDTQRVGVPGLLCTFLWLVCRCRASGPTAGAARRRPPPPRRRQPCRRC